MALAEQADLVVSLSLRDGLTSGIRSAQSRVDALRRDFARTGQSVDRLGRNLRFAGLGLAGAAALAISEFAKFEDQLATINTVANVTDDELSAIGQSLQALAVESGTSLPDLTAAFYDLVSAGVQAADAQLVLKNANMLAIGGLSTTGEAVSLLTTALNSYGLEAEQVTTITNGFAQTIALGTVTASDLAGALARVAPIAAASGVGIDELQAGFAKLTSAGIPAAEAATYMRSAIQALNKPSGGLLKLQNQLGVSFSKIAKNRGLAAAYQLLRKEAAAYGLNINDLIGRSEALTYVFSVTGDQADKYSTMLKEVRRANDDGGVAVQQFNKRQQTLASSFDRLQEAGRTTALIFGASLAPALQRVTDRVVTLVVDHKEDIEELGAAFGTFLDEIVTTENLDKAFDTLQSGFDYIAGIDWSTVKGAFETTAAIASQAVSTFNMLPQPVKDSLVALLAVNKVTGGLATSLVRDVGSLFLRSLTTIQAASVTVVAGSVSGGTGGGTGAPVPPGGRGGISAGGVLRGAAGAMMTVGTLIAVAETADFVGKQVQASFDSVSSDVAGAKDKPGREALKDLAGFNRYLTGRRPLNELGENILLGDQFRTALTGFGTAITGDRTLSPAQMMTGIEQLQKASEYAMSQGWTETVQSLDRQRAILELRLGKLDKTTETAGAETKRAVDALDLQVNVSASTTLSVSDVGEKLVVASGGGRFLIR